MYSIEFTKEAAKALAAMPRNVGAVVMAKIELKIGARGGVYQ